MLLLPAGELLNGVPAFHRSSKEIKATPDTGALPGSQDSPEFFNHKATLSGSFIPFVFADTARMKPMPQKQPGVEQGEEETQQNLPKDKVSHLTISQGTAVPSPGKLRGIWFSRYSNPFRKSESLAAHRDLGAHLGHSPAYLE